MIKKLKRTSALVVSLLMVTLLISCSVQPSKIGNPEKFVKETTYTKDVRTGLCFAIIAIRPATGAAQTGIGWACVECTPEVEKLIANDAKALANDAKAYPYSY